MFQTISMSGSGTNEESKKTKEKLRRRMLRAKKSFDWLERSLELATLWTMVPLLMTTSTWEMII